MHHPNHRTAFTLIELLVVVGVLGVTSLVVVLALNPAELLRRTRDTTRLSDVSIINTGVGLFQTDVTNGYFGDFQTVYVSLPDSTATTTQGTNCSTLGLPTLPSEWAYHCAGPTTLRNINGTGWIPINFGLISFRTPFSQLPTDPVNTSSTGLYYTYQKGSWEITAGMESAKYRQGGSKDLVSSDGGLYTDLFEIGTNKTLLPVDRIALLGTTTTSTDTTPPTVSLTSPSNGATVSSTILIAATASDNIGVAGVQFKLDGGNLNPEVTTLPYQTNWNTASSTTGSHTLTATARDAAGNTATSLPIGVVVTSTPPSPPPPPPPPPTWVNLNELPEAVGRVNSSVPPPASIQNGDIIVIIFNLYPNSVSYTPPAGFTAYTGYPILCGTVYPSYCAAYWKRASNESGNYVFTHAAAWTQAVSFNIRGGVASGSVEDVSFAPAQGSSTTYTAPGSTTTVNGTHIIYFAIGGELPITQTSPPTGTTPTFTERYDVGGTSYIYVASGPMTTAGTTGSKSITNANQEWMAGMLSVK